MAEIEWLLFMAQLPATPSSLRVKVWRRLREAGATSLQNGVWILPRNAENTAFMERLLAFARQKEASGQVFLVQGLNQAIQDDIVARFVAERDQDYAEFLEQCAGFLSEIEKETRAHKFTFAELEENEQSFQRLRKWVTNIQKRDFFKTVRSREATAAFQDCRESLQVYTHQVYSEEGMDASYGTGQSLDDVLPSNPEVNNDFE